LIDILFGFREEVQNVVNGDIFLLPSQLDQPGDGEYSSSTSSSNRFSILFPVQINFHKNILSGYLNDQFVAVIEIRV